MATENPTVGIAIFKGEPLDYQKFRHTLLFFGFAGQPLPTTIHAIGPPQEFELQVRDNYNPRTSRTFAKDVNIGHLRVPISKAQLVNLVSQTPINNSDPEFNCHMWVEAALKRLKDQGYITGDDYTKGVNGMVDATMEAKDEP